jgi:hypothetical protein
MVSKIEGILPPQQSSLEKAKLLDARPISATAIPSS